MTTIENAPQQITNQNFINQNHQHNKSSITMETNQNKSTPGSKRRQSHHLTKMLLFINSILVLILSLACQLIECGAYPAIQSPNNNRFNSLNYANRQPAQFAQNDSHPLSSQAPIRQNNGLHQFNQPVSGLTNSHSFSSSGAPLPQSVTNNNQNPYTAATNNALLELRQQMLTRALKFDEHFRTLLSTSKISLHRLFLDTYGLMYERNVDIFTSMYESLEQYYARGDVNLTKSMGLFFERLYQKIFQEYNSNRAFSVAYLECATEQLNSLKPFKDAPEKLISEVRHAFVAARTFYQALNSGIDVIKSILTLGQPSQCVNLIHDKLLKPFSGLQQHPSRQLPCLNYCEQVMTRCVGRTNLDQVSDKWKNYVLSLAELAKKLSFHYNIETIIAPLDVQISEAIMNFQENASNITNQVFEKCSKEAGNTGGHHSYSSHHSPMRPMMNVNRLNKRAAAPASNTRQRQAAIRMQLSSSSSDFGSSFDINLSPQRSATSGRFALPGPTSSNHQLSELVDADNLHQSAQIGKRSPILIDEIKNFMSSTRLFWSTLPNSVCTSNTTINSMTIPLAIQSNNQLPPKRLQQQQQQQQQQSATASSNCFQEPLGMSDMNTDLRYQTEVQSQVAKLDSMNVKIKSALDGHEIDWQTGTAQVAPEHPTAASGRLPARPFNVPQSFPSSTTSTTSSTTTTTTPEPGLTDDEQPGSGDEEDFEPGSGQAPDQPELPEEATDELENSTTEAPDEDYPVEDIEEDNPNTSTGATNNNNNDKDKPTSPSPDATIEGDLAEGKPTPSLDLPNDLITPPDVGAQKSSAARSPTQLVITTTTTACSLLFALFALSIVNQIR